MILQDTSSRRLPRWGTAILLFGLLGALAMLWPRSGKEIPAPPQAEPARISCDAEQIVQEVIEGESDSSLLFVAEDGSRLRNGETQSDEQAHSGTYACRLDDQHNFGMTYAFRDIRPNDRFRVSVWRYNTTGFQASLVTDLGGVKDGYVRHVEAVEVKENGWKRIEARLVIPYDYAGGEFRVYVYGYGLGEAYFDDLLIERIRPADSLALVEELPQIDLEIPEKGMRKLDEKRMEAINRGLLTQGPDDWTKGRILSEEEEIPVKVRLKGDLPDHFRASKWSFRIKTKDPHAWNRLITFSLHTPIARGHLAEWLYHKWLDRVDVLNPRYDFAHLKLNGVSKGLYAWEEHFEKQLIESRARREGPILKLDEAGVWDVRQRAMDYGLDWGEMERQADSYEAAHPQAFQESKILADTVLKGQLQIANTLLRQFQLGELPASEVFDVDALAKYCVITDLTQAYHGLIWHNLRFYYNPVTSLLEPIGFDGFTETGAFLWLRRPIMGANIDHSDRGSLANLQVRRWFLDPEVAAAYHTYLEAWTRPGQVKEWLLDLDPQIRQREALIQLEFPAYDFRSAPYVNRAEKIRQLIFPYSHSSVKAYIREKDPDSIQLAIFNHHLLSLEIIGWGRTDHRISTSLDTPLFLWAKGGAPLHEFSLKVPGAAKFLYYRVPGLDSIYQSRIFGWNPAEIRTPRQSLQENLTVQEGDLYRVQDRQIHVRSGKHQLEESWIIPSGYQLNIGPGTELDLVKGAAIISHAPVFIEGNETNPIRIVSSDGSGQGLAILQAGQESILDHVQFVGLRNLDQSGWSLTGAVSFYESPVRISHCLFTQNQCEDGLNIIRSSFSMFNTTISETFSDGFDADFCQGEVRDCFFSQTGNDGMDFSGSQIQVRSCRVVGAGDKGISAGEESTIEVWNLEVEKSVTAAASKDLSSLLIHSIRLEDCQTGFAAYQKKPEFGGGEMTVKTYDAKGIRYLHLIDKGSRLVLRGKEVEGI